MKISEDLANFLQGSNARPPRRLGQRYSTTQFLPEAGNTVVCHLDPSDLAGALILAARDRLQTLPGADGLLFTPPESLHMTVFDGVIETGRPAVSWPDGLAEDAGVAEATAMMLERLEGFVPPAPFAVQVSGIYPGGLWLEGVTEKDEARLWHWRDALADCFGLRFKGHESYRFHMTFAYPVAWLPDEHAEEWGEALADTLADLRAGIQAVPLCAPAFCTFADMTSFPELRVLQP